MPTSFNQLEAIKVCSLCGVAKSLDQFHRRTRSRDGYQSHCADCGRIALDAADAKHKQTRAETRSRPPAPSLPPRPYPRPAGPAVPAWLLAYEAAVLEDENAFDGARQDAREAFAQACLAWVLRTRADEVHDCLIDVALAGALSPLDALYRALFDPDPDDPHDPAYWAADAVSSLAQVHEDCLLERLPDAARPLVQPLLPSYQAWPAQPGTPSDGSTSEAAGGADSGESARE